MTSAVAAACGLMLVPGAAPTEAQATEKASSARCVFSYESGFQGWQPDTDGLGRDWSITRSTEQASDGAQSLKYWLDAADDDGTIWVERQFRVLPYQTVTVDLAFDLWAAAPSDFNRWPVVAYVGTKSPSTEEEFSQIGDDLDHEGWKSYGHSAKVRAGRDGTIWVAYGVSATWETGRTHYLDCASVTIRRR